MLSVMAVSWERMTGMPMKFWLRCIVRSMR
jgi:hypothetical protein